MKKILVVSMILLYAQGLAAAEFDCEVGDVYCYDDGTPAIVTFVSEDRLQITTNAALYKEREARQRSREAEQEAARRAQETEERQLRRDQVQEGILRELKQMH